MLRACIPDYLLNNKLLVYPAIPIRHRPRRHVWRIYGGCLKATTPSLVYALRISLSTPVLPLAILRRLVYVVHALRPSLGAVLPLRLSSLTLSSFVLCSITAPPSVNALLLLAVWSCTFLSKNPRPIVLVGLWRK